MEICVVTGLHIPYNTKVVLIPLVQVRELHMTNDCLYRHGAHCYFQPALLPFFGRTDDDRTFEPDYEENEKHFADYSVHDDFEYLDDLTEWIVQCDTLPDNFGRKNVIGDHFNYALVLRSVWDQLAADNELDKYSELDRMLRRTCFDAIIDGRRPSTPPYFHNRIRDNKHCLDELIGLADMFAAEVVCA